MLVMSDRACEGCGAEMPDDAHPLARYCPETSAKCRQQAYRRRGGHPPECERCGLVVRRPSIRGGLRVCPDCRDVLDIAVDSGP